MKRNIFTVAAIVGLAIAAHYGFVSAEVLALSGLVAMVGSTLLTESAHTGEFILSEANGKRSRENVVIASGQVLGAGAVVGKQTSGGAYAMYNNLASDGTQAAAGILLAAVDATAGDTPGVIIARDAEVIAAALDWESGGGSETAGLADLLALGIIAR